MLVSTVNPKINAMIVLVAVASPLAVSDGVMHSPEISLYPELHTSQVELLVLRHFWQFEEVQATTFILTSFCNDPVIPLSAEFI